MEKIYEIIAQIDEAIYKAKINEAIDGLLAKALAFLDEKIPALRGGKKEE